MKKLIFSVLLGLLFTGCATDGIYNAGKTIYIAGKKVVVANWDELPEDTKEKLKKIDKAAITYDSARGVIKPAIEDAVKEVKKNADSNSTKIREHQ